MHMATAHSTSMLPCKHSGCDPPEMQAAVAMLLRFIVVLQKIPRVSTAVASQNTEKKAI